MAYKFVNKLVDVNSSAGKMVFIIFSRIWAALIGLVLIPVYIKIIGVESFGLVAFYGTLAGSLVILDAGLSAAITRQTAVLRTQKDKTKEFIDLAFSVERLNWLIAIVTGIVIILLSYTIATHWVNAKELPVKTIAQSVMLMGLLFAFQFPASVYDGIMIGLEKQVANAVINIVFTTLKAVGVIIALKFISPTIECYFIWQTILTLLLTLTMRAYVWKKISVAYIKPRFSKTELKKIAKFAGGITGITLITFFVAQIDKIVVSKFLLLEFVGYYSLAFSIAAVLNQILSPFQSIVYPKLTGLHAQNNKAELINIYHKSCRWISIIVFPIGFILIFFAKEILFFWSKNEVLTLNTAAILQVCTVGTICNCLMWVPYWYMLALGKTKFTIYQNIIAAIIMIPLLYWLTIKYGALGASFVWLIVNVGYVIFSIPIFHRLYLRGELSKWYKNDIAYPFIAAATLFSTAKYLQISFLPDISITYFAIMIFSVALLYIFLIPELRQKALDFKLKFL